jgi:hypothetical protein
VLDEFQEGKASDIEDIRDKIKELKKLRREATSDQKARIEEILDELEELEATLKDMEDDVEEGIHDFETHNITVDEQSFQITLDDLDGETTTYTFTGSTIDPFDENANPASSNDPFGTETGSDETSSDSAVIQDGVVVSDENGDKFYTMADVEYAAKADRDAALDKQTVFLKGDSDLTITLMSIDGDKKTLKVTDADGNHKFIVLEGNINIVFGTGIHSNDLDYIKDTWPPDLLKSCFWQGNDKSFYERMFEEEVTGTDRLKVIPGYEDTKLGLGSIPNNSTDGSLSATLMSRAIEAINLLFGMIDEGTLDNSDEVWDEILEGLSSSQKALLIQHLIQTVAINSPQHFEHFFGPVLNELEQILSAHKQAGSDDPTVGSKVALLMLYTQTSMYEVTGPEEQLKDLFGYSIGLEDDDEEDKEHVEGAWKDDVTNLQALEIFEDILTQNSKLNTFDVNPYKKYADSFIYETHEEHFNGNLEAMKNYDGISYDGKYDGSYEKLDDGMGTSTKPGELYWAEFLDYLSHNLFDENGNIVDNALRVIKDACYVHSTKYFRDEFMANLIVVLNDVMPEEFKNELFPMIADGFFDWFDHEDYYTIYDVWIPGGKEGRNANKMDEAKEILSKYTVSSMDSNPAI